MWRQASLMRTLLLALYLDKYGLISMKFYARGRPLPIGTCGGFYVSTLGTTEEMKGMKRTLCYKSESQLHAPVAPEGSSNHEQVHGNMIQCCQKNINVGVSRLTHAIPHHPTPWPLLP